MNIFSFTVFFGLNFVSLITSSLRPSEELVLAPESDLADQLLDTVKNSTNAKERIAAIKALGGVKVLPARAYTILVESTKSEDPLVREVSASSLRRYKTVESAAVLQQMIEGDKDNLVRKSAISSIGMIGPVAKKSIPSLIKVLSNPRYHDKSYFNENSLMRVDNLNAEAAWALVRIGADSADSLIGVAANTKESLVLRCLAIEALVELRVNAKGVLSNFLKLTMDGEETIRRRAIIGVISIDRKSIETRRAIYAGLADPSDYIQATAASVIYDIDSDNVVSVPILSAILRSKDLRSVNLALYTLSEIGSRSKPAIPAIMILLNSSDKSIRKSAIMTLGSIREASVDVVAALKAIALNDKDIEIKECANDALGLIRNKK